LPSSSIKNQSPFTRYPFRAHEIQELFKGLQERYEPWLKDFDAEADKPGASSVGDGRSGMGQGWGGAADVEQGEGGGGAADVEQGEGGGLMRGKSSSSCQGGQTQDVKRVDSAGVNSEVVEESQKEDQGGEEVVMKRDDRKQIQIGSRVHVGGSKRSDEVAKSVGSQGGKSASVWGKAKGART